MIGNTDPSPMVNRLDCSPNMLSSTCTTEHFLFYGILLCVNRKCVDFESQRTAAQHIDIDSWCKFNKHGNLYAHLMI